ncbi:hypothetical protein XELAEV_180224595mg, partial [Xenopus laevis]
EPSTNLAFIITVFVALVVFCALYILVYTESFVQKWLRVFSLVIYICLLTIGYVLTFDSSVVHTWDQVPFFLFITFSVYTMLPLGMQTCVIISIISGISHIIVISITVVLCSGSNDAIAFQ